MAVRLDILRTRRLVWAWRYAGVQEVNPLPKAGTRYYGGVRGGGAPRSISHVFVNPLLGSARILKELISKILQKFEQASKSLS